MKKIILLIVLIVVSFSTFGNELEKIEYSGKGAAVYKGKKLYFNKHFTDIYKEAGADDALKMFNKGMTKVYVSMIPSFGAGFVGYFAYAHYQDNGSIHPGYTLGSVGLLSGAIYLSYLGTADKKKSINIYNDFVDEKKDVSFIISPIAAPETLGVMFSLNF